MIKCNIVSNSLEVLTVDRSGRRGTVKYNTMLFERKRRDEAISKKTDQKTESISSCLFGSIV